ncbi:MAG TPA: carbohydrate binding domain-containing protein, partial [Sedimentisphaerales bacterium]|nr:carbohydrate binding domain-containing protein [Sedimentisphaerales bacterium]
HVFEAGKKYTVSAFLKCKEGTLDIRIKPERGEDPWEGYSDQVFTMTDTWAEYSVTTPVFTEDVNPASITFHIAFAPAEFWVDGVRFYEGDYVPPAFKKRLTAKDPSPEDGAVDVPRDTVLSWAPGPFADTHNVYFGTVFDDVNNADTTNTRDMLVSKGQTATTYDPEGLLEFSQTYYWRIDEVNAPPDSTVFKGDVWSFTAEPYAYPIANITATASSSNSAAMGPAKTTDGSGLNAGDRHSVEPTDMWLSSATGPQPTWIQYEFDRPCILLEMWVWNSNQLLESLFGLGAKDVTVEYSEDGVNWTSLGDFEFARAPGSADYTHDTTVDMAGAMAKYVRLTTNSNWGGLLPQYGLSEVRFFYIPVQAREPIPISGGKGVERDVVLDWRAGREAASHEVSFSSDKDAVINGTAPVDMATESRYEPGLLEFGQTYYWKVNEVNDAASSSSREGDLWSFSTIEYLVIDDFEGYDTGDNQIWYAWHDGLGYGTPGTEPYFAGNGTGAAVGDETTDSYTEEIIVHGGNQAMPLFYDNNQQGKFKYSEVELTLSDTRNWTEGGVTELSLWFHGEPDNTAETLYVAINGNAIVYNDNPDAALITEWTQWNIDLQAFADQGVNLANVNTIALGLGDKTNPAAGGSGKMYFDDIAVGHPIKVEIDTRNILANGGFEDGVIEPWGFWGDATAEVVTELVGAAVPEAPIEGGSCLHITVNSAGANDWDYGLNQGEHVFEAGKQYTVSAFLKCKEGTLDIRLKPERGADPWEGYSDQVFTMTDQWAEYSVTTPVFTEDVSPASITFHIAFAAGDFWVDGVRFVEVE